tara:strand:- start:18926 stop:19540 length:615 start_codon:yes stop_codon:yes gene_type:complete
MFQSTKTFELGSVAFRQWRAKHSHCQYLHGYQLKVKVVFGAKKLDDKNWVQDFGGLKSIRSELQELFDHRVVVAGDDPELKSLKELQDSGVLKLTIMETGVGCEKFAEFVANFINNKVSDASGGRVNVVLVELFEHTDNSAVYIIEDSISQQLEAYKTSAETQIDKLPNISVKAETPKENPNAASVGPNTSQGIGNMFGGTRLG